MLYFFFTSRRRHTRCALVTGVQTCALPIFTLTDDGDLPLTEDTAQDDAMIRRHVAYVREDGDIPFALGGDHAVTFPLVEEIGRASGRERGCQYVLISVVAVSLNNKHLKQRIHNTSIGVYTSFI